MKKSNRTTAATKNSCPHHFKKDSSESAETVHAPYAVKEVKACTGKRNNRAEEKYHTLLPRYLQDALRRAAGDEQHSGFERLCAIDRVALSARTEYPKGFRHDY